MKPDFVFHPQPMFAIGTKNEDGSANFCLITWASFSLDGVPHVALTIGGSKLTKTNILREGRFSANLITEELLPLADYFGNVSGQERAKDAVPCGVAWGSKVDVPTLADCRWVYECTVTRVLALEGSHLILGRIDNIQVDERLAGMDMKRMDLCAIRPVIYGPYQYFSIGERLGESGDFVPEPFRGVYADGTPVKPGP